MDENGHPSFQRLANMTGFGTRPAVMGAAPFLNFFASICCTSTDTICVSALIDRRQLLMSILPSSEVGVFGTFMAKRRTG